MVGHICSIFPVVKMCQLGHFSVTGVHCQFWFLEKTILVYRATTLDKYIPVKLMPWGVQ